MLAYRIELQGTQGLMETTDVWINVILCVKFYGEMGMYEIPCEHTGE